MKKTQIEKDQLESIRAHRKPSHGKNEKINGPAPETKKTPIQEAAEQKDAKKPVGFTKEQFFAWADKDFNAARAYLNLIATRPHILELLKEELYKTTVMVNSKLDD